MQLTRKQFSLVTALVYLGGSLAAAFLLKVGGPRWRPWAIVPLIDAIVLTAIIGAIYTRRNDAYRRALLGAAAILAVGIPVAAFVAGGRQDWFRGSSDMLMSSWIYVWALADVPSGRSGWCASPWIALGGSLLLVAMTWIVGAIG